MQPVRQPHAQRHDTDLAARRDPAMRAHHQQLRTRGKLGKVALVACMRKLLTIVNAGRRDELRVAGGSLIAV
jgi:transposase